MRLCYVMFLVKDRVASRLLSFFLHTAVPLRGNERRETRGHKQPFLPLAARAPPWTVPATAVSLVVGFFLYFALFWDGLFGQGLRCRHRTNCEAVWNLSWLPLFSCLAANTNKLQPELRVSSLERGQLAGAAQGATEGLLRRLDGVRGHAYGHR